VSPDEEVLTSDQILDAFRRLGDRLARRGVVADLYVFGGAATALAYDGAAVVFQNAGLRVSAASPEHLLAMKVLAARRRDIGDIRLLVERLELTSVIEVLAVCAEVFPDEEVPARARLILEDLFAG
jgi:hypothetical protein